jgi:hypothetical protein
LERIPSTQYILNQYLKQLTNDDNNDHPQQQQKHQSPPSWMAPTNARANANGDTKQMIRFLLGNDKNNSTDMDTSISQQQQKQYNYSSFNTTILDYLNNLTKPEQEYFGYLPLTVSNIFRGTVDLITDD